MCFICTHVIFALNVIALSSLYTNQHQPLMALFSLLTELKSQLGASTELSNGFSESLDVVNGDANGKYSHVFKLFYFSFITNLLGYFQPHSER